MDLGGRWQKAVFKRRRARLAGLLVVLLCCHPRDSFTALFTAQTVIPAGATPASLDLPAFAPLNIAASRELTSQGLDLSRISSARPLEVSLRVVDPGTERDLTFIGNAHVWATLPGQPDLLLAQGSAFAADNSLVGLDVVDVDLLPYAHSKDLSLRLDVQPTPLNQDVTLEAQVRLQLVVNETTEACALK